MKSNRLEELTQNYEALINRKNEICNNSNGIYKRYYHPVLTAEHAPLIWKYDFDEKQNPFMEERIGINAVMNTGAIINTILWRVWKEQTENHSLQ